MLVLVTGAAGMIGRKLSTSLKAAGHSLLGIDLKTNDDIIYCDLGDKAALEKIFKKNKIDRVIHLAALAHTMSGKKYTKEMYRYLNVDCAKNVFDISNKYCVPVLFVSTVDVFGFVKGVANAKTKCNPITIYGKTKYEAEQYLRDNEIKHTVFRLSPVYSENVKRDILKRIYLKYPNIAYQIGKNTQYEVLNIDTAVNRMIDWLSEENNSEIKIIKDEMFLNTKDYISSEKNEGRARLVLRIPRFVALVGYFIIRMTGKNKYTFLINKAIHPLRTE